jgi:intracellular sulfur oxidation DsrE/DsrF family protein
MPFKPHLFNLLFLFLVPLVCCAQSRKAGPVVPNYGAVWPIDEPDYKTNTDEPLKVVFDIMNSPESYGTINASIETAARFLNMHAQAGVPSENLYVALVVHNKASKDVVLSEFYHERYGVENPNEPMIRELIDAGVQVIFCGQSSLSRNFPKTEIIEGVQLSLSAMTALIQLQNQGYRLVKF